MFCPKCHEIYDDGSVYCVACGTRLVFQDPKIKQGSPMERHSSRFKSSKPDNENKVNSKYKKITSNDNKIDILILQNKELIKQNNRIIELLEMLTR